MIMRQCYRADLIDTIKQSDAAVFNANGINVDNLLQDKETIERLWFKYQKNIEDYDMKSIPAFMDACHEVLGIRESEWGEMEE